MAHGKMKTLHGLYKKVGRDAFLEAAKSYSDHGNVVLIKNLDKIGSSVNCLFIA